MNIIAGDEDEFPPLVIAINIDAPHTELTIGKLVLIETEQSLAILTSFILFYFAY